MKKKRGLPQTLTVKRNEHEPESMELVAQSIIDLDAAFKRLLTGPLKAETIVLLLHDMTKLSRTDIRKVLEAAGKIRQTYLK